jgi:hypothetical protein
MPLAPSIPIKQDSFPQAVSAGSPTQKWGAKWNLGVGDIEDAALKGRRYIRTWHTHVRGRARF